ncbi:MAG: 2-amino-4-hydroxy-6-hydroxymethyldihydropteridine diphosphokinase [Nitrospirae bacterium]|nr:2-amino-4-hydroxy-6-hydroxymethyldihydropteridine diphosphokinase [Candidatus Troglogloeales bacterium]MBI3598184.1 2-amino-4-hydroxy-6-hydroxymethyldihydropteridine diphosphokinase [Candidatus Troglogloeales bacterium]
MNHFVISTNGRSLFSSKRRLLQSSLVYVGIGSNVGDRLDYCQKAFSLLCSSDVGVALVATQKRAGTEACPYNDIVLTAVSSLYETEPTDCPRQDWFYNAVVAVRTTLSPILLLQCCQEIELSLGKNIKIPKGPRTIDLDILFYQDAMIHSPDLIVPHPSALSRRFVLIPMAEIAPDFIPPENQQTIKAICEGISEGSIVRQKQGPEWATVTPHRVIKF